MQLLFYGARPRRGFVFWIFLNYDGNNLKVSISLRTHIALYFWRFCETVSWFSPVVQLHRKYRVVNISNKYQSFLAFNRMKVFLLTFLLDILEFNSSFNPETFEKFPRYIYTNRVSSFTRNAVMSLVNIICEIETFRLRLLDLITNYSNNDPVSESQH